MSKKKLITAIVLCLVVIVGLIFATVYLTGGRDIGDFTKSDEYIFGGFVVLECAVAAALILFIRKLNKGYPATGANVQAPDFPVSPSAKKHAKVCAIVSLVVTILFWCCGLYFHRVTMDVYKTLFTWGTITSMLIPVLLIFVSIMLRKRYVKKFYSMNFGERQSYIASHRDEAYKTVSQKQAVLKSIYIISKLYTLVLILCGVVFAFCYQRSSVYPLLVAFLLIKGGLANFYTNVDNRQIEDAESVATEDYPVIYGLARKAAEAVGYNKEIKVSINAGFNAGIGTDDNCCLLQLGVLLINSLTQDELYAVLLHEFAHLNASSFYDKNGNFYRWLSPPCLILPSEKLTKYMYDYLGTVWQFNYDMYTYACSIMIETESDKAMALCGDAKIAASALIKLYYYNMYDWEKGTYDTVSPFVAEQYDRGMVKRELDAFGKAMENRAEFWNKLAEKEIISRSTTHPILRMRLETLGVSDIKVVKAALKETYKLEQAKSIEYVEDLITKNFETEEKYSEVREREYLGPKKRIEEWEEAGRPIVGEDYADIISDLRSLGRNIEAHKIAEQAMEVLDDAALHNAYFMYGAFLLHSFNDDGLEYVYEAVESNFNYIHEGMNLVGAYCCMTGNEDRLEEYRQRVNVYGQDLEDKYEKTGYIMKEDTLTAEKLPDGMLEDILSFINTVDEGMIDRIHLVRKVITEDFFTSAFVITFLPEAEEKQMHRIMHKIFSYLDTCGDWQFSLFMNCDVPMASIIAVEHSLVYER